jgi:hypothetical protein
MVNKINPNVKYTTYEQAKAATNNLGIIGWPQYRKRYKEDPKLPCRPDMTYKKEYEENGGAPYFYSGLKSKDFYTTYEDARAAVNILGIKSEHEYFRRYYEDARLPRNPRIMYKADYLSKGGASYFFSGIQMIALYETYDEARIATQKLGIDGQRQYNLRYKEDPKLPSHPCIKYSQEYIAKGGGDSFFLTTPKHYETVEKTIIAIKKLGISTLAEYKLRYKEDPMLMSNPLTRFRSINDEPIQLFSSPTRKYVKGAIPRKILKYRFYLTVEQAIASVVKLGITSRKDYLDNCHKDPCLPKVPENIYKDYFSKPDNYKLFYCINASIYETYDEARIATQNLGIKSRNQYKRDYKVDPKLPSNPWIKYRDVFQVRGGAKTFFLK